jgi:hypothetical protein
MISSIADDDLHSFGAIDHIDLPRSTAPAWLMALMWAVYLLAVLIFFDEPIRANCKTLLLQACCCCCRPKRRQGVRSALLSTDYSSIQLPEDEPHPVGEASGMQLWCGCCRWPWWLSKPGLTLTLSTCLLGKMVQEVVIVSAAVVSKRYWRWDSIRVGTYLAALGLLMMPLNLFAGRLSKRHDDRDLVVAFETVIGLGLGVTLVHNAGYSVGQYIVGATLVFVGASLLDGVAMSLLSKLLSRALSKQAKAAGHKTGQGHKFASGLLGSEAADLGRAFGNFLLFTSTQGLDDTVDTIFIPLGGALLFAFVALCWNRRALADVAYG